MSSSYGEELETGPAARSGTAPVPHPTTVLRLDWAQSETGKGLRGQPSHSARAFLYAASIMLLVRRIARAS